MKANHDIAIDSYAQTNLGYDILERRNRVETPGGTITRTVWTTPQRVASVWVGTDDTGATDADPSGSNRIQFVQAGTKTAAGSSVAVNLESNVTAGNTLVAFGSVHRTIVPGSTTLSDNLGNTWTQIATKAGASAAAGAVSIWICNIAAGHDGDMTITFAPISSNCALAVAEYSGIASSSALDASASASSSTGSTTPASGTITTTNAQDVLIGGGTSASNVVWAPGSGFISRGEVNATSSMSAAIEEQILTATGTPNASFTISASSAWTAIGVALKSATASSSNNMVMVKSNIYDGGYAGQDGNLSQQTQYADGSTTRVTNFGYDYRDRRISITDAVGVNTALAYDNIDRLNEIQRYAPTTNYLIDQTVIFLDDRNRVYQTWIYAVDITHGTPGHYLVGKNWYDYSGNLIQSIRPGDGQKFVKNVYNAVGWIAYRYVAYNTGGTSWSQANDDPQTAGSDIIIEQIKNSYDDAGNLTEADYFQRLNDAPQSGMGSTRALSLSSNPKARVYYSCNWFDGADRPIANANYGADTGFTSRPSMQPSTGTGPLVNNTTYDSNSGRIATTVDPKNITTALTFDDAGRKKSVVEDSGGLNRETDFTYTLDDLIATMTAINPNPPGTGNQTTTWTYGTTLSTSDVARNDLVASITYPDGGSDVVAYKYNRLGQKKKVLDQRGTERTISYDGLGRFSTDCVTSNGTGTDVSVKQIWIEYEVRGMVYTITTTDNASPKTGTVLNQVQLDYNDFSQLIKEWQDHSTTVSGSTPYVQYDYDSGASASNEIRMNQITYPDSAARVIALSYGTSGGMNDYLNRIDTISDTVTSTDLASYTYVGLGLVVQISYPSVSVMLDLWQNVSGVFAGLDNFNRVIDQLWLNTTGPTTLDEYKYGYDDNSNRIWKQNITATTAGKALDELYAIDNLNRLLDMKRGTLTVGPPPSMSSPAYEQSWTLDPTSNWSAYEELTSGTPTLNQTRTSSTVNTITAFPTGPAWTVPVYDPAGNMTTVPQTSTPTASFTATYDAWNRMTEILDGSNNGAAYQYDGRGRRIVRQAYTGGTVTETRDFYFTDDGRDIEQRVGGLTTMDQQHVWGIRYINELICRYDATPAQFFVCQDANFNVTTLVNASGGSVSLRVTYSPYSLVSFYDSSWSSSGYAYSWIYLFQGGRYDPATGLHLFGIRDLSPVVGAWIQRDPAGYVDGGSIYLFTRANPTTQRDFSGLGSIEYVQPEMAVSGNHTRDTPIADVTITAEYEKNIEPSPEGCIGNVKVTLIYKWHPLTDDDDQKSARNGDYRLAAKGGKRGDLVYQGDPKAAGPPEDTIGQIELGPFELGQDIDVTVSIGPKQNPTTQPTFLIRLRASVGKCGQISDEKWNYTVGRQYNNAVQPYVKPKK